MQLKHSSSRPFTFGLAIAAAATLAACASSTGGGSGGSAGTVNVAVLLPLTGAHAPFGTALADGAETAAYVINQAGGVSGKKVKIIAESTGGDPIDAVTLTRAVLAEDHPSMFIAFGGSDYPEALPIAAGAHVVVFADVGDPALDKQTDPYVYRAVPSDSLTGTAMAWWAHHEGYQRVALVFDAASGAQTLVPPIQAAAKRLGFQIVATRSTDLAESAPSYETTVREIISAHPQALLLQLEPAGAGTFFHELDALGGQNMPVIGSDSTSTAEWVAAIGAAAAQRQLTSVVAATGSLTGAPGQQFSSAFQHLFHAAPRSLSDSDYDAMIVGALAMDAARSTDPAKFRPYIDAVTTAGAGHVPVYTYAQGLQELKRGKQIDYVGLSSPWQFNQYHAITATYDAVKTAPNGNVQLIGTISANQLATVIK
jgi:branched-chain amino acid transport system substrate-binding protein